MKRFIIIVISLFLFAVPVFAAPAQMGNDYFVEYIQDNIKPNIDKRQFNTDLLENIQGFKLDLAMHGGKLTKEESQRYWSMALNLESIMIIVSIPDRLEDKYADFLKDTTYLENPSQPFSSLTIGMRYIKDKQKYKQNVMNAIDTLKAQGYFKDYRVVDLTCFCLEVLNFKEDSTMQGYFDKELEQLKEENRGRTYARYYPEDEHYMK